MEYEFVDVKCEFVMWSYNCEEVGLLFVWFIFQDDGCDVCFFSDDWWFFYLVDVDNFFVFCLFDFGDDYLCNDVV